MDRHEAAEVETVGRARVVHRVLVLVGDHFLDDRAGGDPRERSAHDAVVAEDLELFLGRAFADRFWIELVHGSIPGHDPRLDLRTILVPRCPGSLDGRPAFDRRVRDDPKKNAMSAGRAPLGVERVARLVEEDDGCRVVG